MTGAEGLFIRKTRRMSKAPYLGTCFGAIGLALALTVFLFPILPMLHPEWTPDEARHCIGLYFIWVIGFICAAVATTAMVFIYNAWKRLQDGNARTTPGKAVGFLFIPIFNLYWVFVAFWGFAREYNAYLGRHSLYSRRLSEGLFLAFPVLVLAAFLPFLPANILGGVGALIMALVMFSKGCDAINAIASEEEYRIDEAFSPGPTIDEAETGEDRLADDESASAFSRMTERRESKPVSKGCFVGAYVASYALPWVLICVVGVWAGLDSAVHDAGILIPLAAGTAAIGIFHIVVLMVFTYRMWAAIQDQHARTTPGAAVGFMFVPFYNLYWVFQAYWGFAKDYNTYIKRHSLEAPRLPEGLFLAYSILFPATLILGVLADVAQFAVGIVMISQGCDAINAIVLRRPLTGATHFE